MHEIARQKDKISAKCTVDYDCAMNIVYVQSAYILSSFCISGHSECWMCVPAIICNNFFCSFASWQKYVGGKFAQIDESDTNAWGKNIQLPI